MGVTNHELIHGDRFEEKLGHQDSLNKMGKTVLALRNSIVCLNHEMFWHVVPTPNTNLVHTLDCAAQDLQEPVRAMIDALTGKVQVRAVSLRIHYLHHDW